MTKSHNSLPLFFVIIATNLGGEGKSMIARIIAAMLRMMGESFVLLDADIGNWTSKLREEGAEGLGWGTSIDLAPRMVDTYQGRHVIIDTGANTYASMDAITALLPDLETRFSNVGYSTHAFFPISTNKDKAGDALKAFQKLVVAQRKAYVMVNRDGSGEFDQAPNDLTVVTLNHLQPGFQALLRHLGLPLDQVLTQDIESITEAQPYIADFVKHFMQQPALIEMMSDAPIAVLNARYPIPARDHHRVILDRDHTSNEALLGNQFERRFFDILARFSYTPTGLRQAAQQMEDIGFTS
jgi:hypothetical protein